MKELLAYLDSIYPMTDGLKQQFASVVKVKELSKKSYWLKAGHVCRNACFIHKGLLRCFYEKDGHEICSWFMKEADVMISVESFFTQKESYESIQALEDSILFYISYSDLQVLYQNHLEFNYIVRVLMERYYMMSEQRLFSMRMQRSQERYDYLFKHHPELVLRVPAKYLASYLGISEVTISRIKATY